MEILKEGKLPTATQVCKDCGCEFKYNKNDVTEYSDGMDMVECPCCGRSYNANEKIFIFVEKKKTTICPHCKIAFQIREKLIRKNRHEDYEYDMIDCPYCGSSRVIGKRKVE